MSEKEIEKVSGYIADLLDHAKDRMLFSSGRRTAKIFDEVIPAIDNLEEVKAVLLSLANWIEILALDEASKERLRTQRKDLDDEAGQS